MPPRRSPQSAPSFSRGPTTAKVRRRGPPTTSSSRRLPGQSLQLKTKIASVIRLAAAAKVQRFIDVDRQLARHTGARLNHISFVDNSVRHRELVEVLAVHAHGHH